MSILGWVGIFILPPLFGGKKAKGMGAPAKSFVFSTFSPIPIPRVKVWIGLILPTLAKHLPPKTTFMTTNKQDSTKGKAPPKKESQMRIVTTILNKEDASTIHSLLLSQGHLY